MRPLTGGCPAGEIGMENRRRLVSYVPLCEDHGKRERNEKMALLEPTLCGQSERHLDS
jgi:hypothetical protein